MHMMAQQSRSLRWERGLKSDIMGVKMSGDVSLPSVGAWVEIWYFI